MSRERESGTAGGAGSGTVADAAVRAGTADDTDGIAARTGTTDADADVDVDVDVDHDVDRDHGGDDGMPSDDGHDRNGD